MNKILMITPLYKINGRDELFKDSEAIYDLTKYWHNNNCQLYIINCYINGFSKIKNIFNNNYLKYKNIGYDYKINDINVTLIERQNIIPKQINGNYFDSIRFNKIITTKLNEHNFIPNKIVVHIPSISQFIINKLNYNSEKIAVLHMTDVIYLKKKKDKFIKFLENNYDRIYCRSKNIYDIFNQYGLKNLHDNIIYSGVNNNFHIKDRKFNDIHEILYVGKLIKRKNLDLLINALSKIDNNKWHLNVIGNGPCYKNYLDLVNELNLNKNISFLGSKNKDEVYDYMNNTDIFCMPSINETFGLVYLEAMSFGCLAIGIKNEGIDGVIKDNQNGYLINPNQEDLYNLLDKLINNTSFEEKERISKNAINTSKEFNEEKISNEYLRIIMGD